MSQTPNPSRRLFVGAGAATLAMPATALASEASDLAAASRKALADLYAKNPQAKALGQSAKAVLVFPSIVKAGFVVGGQGGKGTLFEGGKTSFFSIVAGSVGLTIGAQKFAYAMFFMTDAGMQALKKADGWAIGTGPSVVLIDQGSAASLTTATAKNDVYAIAFDQKGLMAALDLEGSKISRYAPRA